MMSCRNHYIKEIRNILKSWIPYILILEPEEFREALIKDVKGWIKKAVGAHRPALFDSGS